MTSDDGAGQHDAELKRTTDILLAEFAARRSELDTRANVLFTLILGNLTVLGVVLGIALSHSGNRDVLLLLPIVTPCIGLLVIDSFRNAESLNIYIYSVIRPKLKISDPEMFDWERQSLKFVFRPLLAGPFQLVLWLEFLGPPIAVLIYAPQHHYLNHLWAWWTGTALTAILFLLAASYGFYSLLSPKGARKVMSSPQPASSANSADRLELDKFADLRNRGVITTEEFERQKAKLRA